MPSRPPVAEVRPAAPGADPYAWMRDTTDPAMLAYLAAERCYYDQQMAHTGAVRAELMAEMSARMAPATESVSWRRGNFAYFTRNVAGLGHEQFCRRPAGEPDGGTGAQGAAAEVLLDENLLLEDPECGGGYVALGVREVSPDGALLAYSVDFDGDEVYQLRIRDLASGADTVTGAGLPERIGRSYYGLAWSADSRCVFYTVPDAAYRPYQVWRHEIGTDPARDALVFTEHDERFEVEVRATRSGAYVLIETACRDTTETLVIPAGDPRAAPFVLQERRKGVEYRADHADGPDGGEFYLVTNDQAAEFRLVRGPAAGRGRWAEVIAGAAGTRLVSCDVFGRYLVVEQRREAATQLRVIDRETGEQRLIEAAGPEVALALAVNEEYRAAAVTVRTESLIDPPSWHDVDLASGGWRLRRRQEVPGYDPAGYRTRRITAPAPDGTAIPVTIAYRAGLPRDGSAPCLLYGYGAYEDCEWPEFSLPVASLLDRGYLYAVAHVRGGGEGGRRWWLEGRLDPQADHVHRLHRGGRRAGRGPVGGGRRDRLPRPVRGRPAAGRGLLDGAAALAGGGGRGAVRGRRHHHARPHHPAHHQRVGRVGRPARAGGPGVSAVLQPLRQHPGRFPAGSAGDRQPARSPGAGARACQVGGPAAGNRRYRRRPGAAAARTRRRGARGPQRPLRQARVRGRDPRVHPGR